MFEDWTTEKMDKYDVDPEVYDHTIIADRPPILIDGYAQHRKYITMLFLLDNRKDLLLASKYDPVQIGLGEAGMNRHDSSPSTNSKVSSRTPKTSSPYKVPPRKSPEEEAQDMVKMSLVL